MNKLEKFLTGLGAVVGIMSEYSDAAEPPVRCGVSHYSGLTEPLNYYLALFGSRP